MDAITLLWQQADIGTRIGVSGGLSLGTFGLAAFGAIKALAPLFGKWLDKTKAEDEKVTAETNKATAALTAVGALINRVNALEGRITTIEGENQRLTASVAALKLELQQAQTDAHTLAGKLERAERVISGLQDIIRNLQSALRQYDADHPALSVDLGLPE